MQNWMIWLWSKIATQEAAGWAQAVGTVAAIWFTAKLARDAREAELGDRARDLRVRGSALALRLLPHLEHWRSAVSRYYDWGSPGRRACFCMLKDLRWGEIAPPQEVVNDLEYLGEYHDIVKPLTRAIFDYRRLSKFAPMARDAVMEMQDSMAESETGVATQHSLDIVVATIQSLYGNIDQAIGQIDALDPVRRAGR